jgi:2-oxoglutarate ferredoxin oxidoreductase subunit delta
MKPIDIVADDVPQIALDAALCKKCGICVAVCPTDVYVADRDGLPLIAEPEMCIWCARCEIYCPDYAIQLTGRRGW